MLREVSIDSDRATNTISTLKTLNSRIKQMASELDERMTKETEMYRLVLVDISRLNDIKAAFSIVEQITGHLKDY